MALNIEKILSHIGETKEEFSSNVDISLERFDELIEGKQKITERELADITGYTDLPPEDICSEFATSKELDGINNKNTEDIKSERGDETQKTE